MSPSSRAGGAIKAPRARPAMQRSICLFRLRAWELTQARILRNSEGVCPFFEVILLAET